jgi:mono/diheme cytochrome c family protein
MRRFAGLANFVLIAMIASFTPVLLQAADDGGGATPSGAMTPLERVASTPKGELKNPYTDYQSVAEQGHKKYFSVSCNGCHGGGGGGGICPPLTNSVWVYGSDDDTLFRLIALGSDGLQKEGYTRKQHETVTGPMPPFGTIIKTDDDLWKIIAWIRSINPSSLNPPSPPPPPPQ